MPAAVLFGTIVILGVLVVPSPPSVAKAVRLPAANAITAATAAIIFFIFLMVNFLSENTFISSHVDRCYYIFRLPALARRNRMLIAIAASRIPLK